MLPSAHPSVCLWLVTDANSECIIQLARSDERRNMRARERQTDKKHGIRVREKLQRAEGISRARELGFTRVDKVGVAALCNVRDVVISAYGQ